MPDYKKQKEDLKKYDFVLGLLRQNFGSIFFFVKGWGIEIAIKLCYYI